MSRLDEIDRICTRYEVAWRAGRALSIESLVSDVEESMREALRDELLLVENELRASRADAELPNQPWTGAASSRGMPVHNYEVGAEIGRGAMGVVYRARHLATGRQVALKVVRDDLWSAGSGGSQTSAQDRFQREIRVAALEHENIVPIYEVFEFDRGRPCYTMRLIDGPNFRELIGDEPFDGRRAATTLVPIARALHFAHERRIVHRDVKPHNILLHEDRHPYITDFGLAKPVGELIELTRAGEPIGTPAYMAPEQVGRGGEITPATDVYGLGATLYHALTGRPPFSGSSISAVLQQVLNHDPPSPRLLNPAVSRDLETICLKCLNKSPAHRFASAGELGDELQRYVDGRPILTRPPGIGERLVKWAQRNQGVALLAFTVTVLLGLATIISSIAAVKFNTLARRHQAARQANHDAWRLEKQLRSEAEQANYQERLARTSAEANLYFARVALATDALTANDAGRALELLRRCVPDDGDVDRRGWEWYYLHWRCHPELYVFDAAPFNAAPVEPSGTTAAVTNRSVRQVGYSPDGQLLAYVAGAGELATADERSACGRVVVRDALTGATCHEFQAPATALECFAFSRDSRLLATGGIDGGVRVWDVETGLQASGLTVPHPVQTVAFVAGGSQLVVGAVGQPLSLWDVDSGRKLRELDRIAADADPRLLQLFAVSADESKLASLASVPHRVVVWDADSWTKTHTFSSQGGAVLDVLMAHDNSQVGFSQADGNATFRRLVGRGHHYWNQAGARCAALDRSGRWLAYAGSSTFVKLTAFSGYGGWSLPGHNRPVNDIAFHPTEPQLVTAGQDGTARVWDLTSPSEGLLVRPGCQSCGDIGFDAGGDRLHVLTTGGASGIATYDAATRVQLAVHDVDIREASGTGCSGGDFSPDGHWLVAPSELHSHVAHIWKVGTGERIATLDADCGLVTAATYGVDGRTIATAHWREAEGGGGDVSIVVWDAAAGTELRRLSAASRRATAAFDLLAVSAEADTVVAASTNGAEVVVWSRTKNEQPRSVDLEAPVHALAMAPRDRRLAVACGAAGGVRLFPWEAVARFGAVAGQGDESAREPTSAIAQEAISRVTTHFEFPKPVRWLAFDPAGRRLAGATLQGEVVLWDTDTTRRTIVLTPLSTDRGERRISPRVTFSRSGAGLASINNDLTVNCWNGKLHTAGSRELQRRWSRMRAVAAPHVGGVPEILPGGGSFRTPRSVVLQAADPRSTLRYTLDGGLPTTASPVYERPLIIDRHVKLCAAAFDEAGTRGEAATAEFFIDPEFLPLDDWAWSVRDVDASAGKDGPSEWSERYGVVTQRSNIHDVAIHPFSPDKNLNGTLRTYVPESGLADGHLTLQANSADDDSIGVAFRVRDDRHYYLFAMNREHNWRWLAVRDGDDYRVLASTRLGYEAERWMGWEIALDGPRIRVSCDGARQFEVVDRTYDSGTIGLYSCASKDCSFRSIRWRVATATDRALPSEAGGQSPE